MIDGLKVTVTGEELRQLLDSRASERRASAAEWQRQRERTGESATENEPLLPDHICANEAADQEWRAEVLTFLRDHVDPLETYLLDMPDLEFVGLTPARPEPKGPDEFEDATQDLGGGWTARRVCDSPEAILFSAPEAPAT